MATLTIGERVPAPLPNTYTLKITTYAGDADYYETLTIKGFRRVEDAELLDELLELLPALQAAYPNGRGNDGDTYEELGLQAFNAWFGDSEQKREDIEAFINRPGQEFSYDWPYAHEYGQEMTVDKWELTYYDDNSNAFAVTINY